MKSGGEIVKVQGGHIVRSTGRKDRHSKVYTAKGARDRRVRLSAHTAIQFYDVQDRLGYDRPSKAVDWLITKAQSAIDKLEKLPPLDPFYNNTGNSISDNGNSFQVDNLPFPNNMFQSYGQELVSSTSNPTQDLCLSLHRKSPTVSTPQTLFAGGSTPEFQSNSVEWPEIQRTVDNRGGFVFSSPFMQREPLQSSYLHSIPGRHDFPSGSGIHFPQIPGGMFSIPARIHGEQEEDTPDSGC